MPYTKERLTYVLKVYRDFPSTPKSHNLANYNLRNKISRPLYDDVGYWQESRRGAQIDDDEWDPEGDRKRPSTANAKRKQAAQKRKADEENDIEKTVKKAKSKKEKHIYGHVAFVTIKFTTEESTSLLRELARIYGKVIPPSRFDEWSDDGADYGIFCSSAIDRKKGSAFAITGFELESSPEHAPELTRGLRNGKIPNKDLSPKRKSKRKDLFEEPFQEDTERPQATPFPPATPTTSIQQRISAIEISSDSEGEADYDDPFDHVPTSSKPSKITSQFTISKSSFSPDPTEPLRKELFNRDTAPRLSRSSQNEPGVTTIETFYAHPIQFQSDRQPCDFCSNYRMGILGLGRRSIQVFIDPSDPTKYHETGDGWRAKGYPETKMCVVCSLSRRMILHCHAEESNQFTHIEGFERNSQRYNAFASDLLDHHKRPGEYQNTWGNDRSILPTCSLCPAPAVWRCCKYQATNILGEPRTVPFTMNPSAEKNTRLPTLTPTSTSSVFGANRGVLSPTPKSSSYATSITSSSTKHHISYETVAGRKREIICLDDDADDNEADLPSPTKRQKTANRTPTPIRFSAPVAFQNPSSSLAAPAPVPTPNPCQEREREEKEVIPGCGLLLCDRCKGCLADRCNGMLDKRRVYRFLRSEDSIGIRADAEFLFKGSDLDRAWVRSGSRNGARNSRLFAD